MKKKLQKGRPIEELVKGSLEYTKHAMTNAFRMQFPYVDGVMEWQNIVDTFSDYVIVSEYGGDLKPDEYYRVTYTRSGDTFTFAPKEQWEVVELAYQPQTTPAVAEGKKSKKRKSLRRADGCAYLSDGSTGRQAPDQNRRCNHGGCCQWQQSPISGSVIEAAITELRGHLNESAGQGRAIQVLGEAEHPSDKGGRPNLLETVTKWEEVTFDGKRVDLTGRILETSKGKDILTLMEGGVMPGVSLRGYGEGKTIGKGDDKIFEVTELHITGFDLVLEPSFENVAQLTESITSQGENEMTLEELLKLLKERPDLFKGVTEAQVKEMGDAQLKILESMIRSALGIDAKADIAESLKETADKARKFEESQKKNAVDAAIAEATRDLPFGKTLNEMFIESVKSADLSSVDAVKAFVESKRKEYSQLAAKGMLTGMGFDEKTQKIRVIGDVLETETGTPEFGRASFEITESIRKHEMRPFKDLRKNESRAAQWTLQLLERFDKMYQRQLMEETRQFNEVEAATDLNLPYSVSRAIIAEAYPHPGGRQYLRYRRDEWNTGEYLV